MHPCEYLLMKRGSVRSRLAVIAGLGCVAAALAGCTATGQMALGSGPSVQALTVSTDTTTESTVSFPTPLLPSRAQCREIVAGTGPRVQPGDVVEVAVSLYLGATGEKLVSVGYDSSKPAKYVPVSASAADVVSAGLRCGSRGSRLAVAIPHSASIANVTALGLIDSQKTRLTDPQQLGLGSGEGFVQVMDIKRVFPGKATGAPQITRDGFPAVALAPNGTPGITIPKKPTPTKMELEILKAGAGPVIGEKSTVLVHIASANWSTGAANSTWQSGAPQPVSLAQEDPSLVKLLSGVKVGSQVGVILPTPASEGQAADASFLVIDILGIL